MGVVCLVHGMVPVCYVSLVHCMGSFVVLFGPLSPVVEAGGRPLQWGPESRGMWLYMIVFTKLSVPSCGQNQLEIYYPIVRLLH